MAKFVVHKKGFFYTDDSFDLIEDSKGSIVGTFDNLDDAKEEKGIQDIKSMQSIAGNNATDFMDDTDYNSMYRKIEEYYKSEFGLTISNKSYFHFPTEINPVQAKALLDILNVSFHDIAEYADDDVLNPQDFILDEELGEF